MIEQLKQIWLGTSLAARLVAVGGIFLIFAFVIFLLSFSRGPAPVASGAPTASVVLNEVLFLPSNNQSQFVELKTLSERGKLAGFKLRNEKNEDYVFPSDAPAVEPNSQLLIVFDGENRAEDATLHAERKSFLNSAAGFVELIAPDGRVVDHVAWGARQPDAVRMSRGGVENEPIPGTTIGRHPLSMARSKLEWTSFSDADVTPGKPNPQPAVGVLLPLSGAFFGGQDKVELSWYPVPGAATYRVQIARDEAFQEIVSDTKADTPELEPALSPGTYFWRVQAIATDGTEGAFSPISVFEVSADDLPTSSHSELRSPSFVKKAQAADIVPPLREGVLSVPMISQHKDTAMLLMESENESGPHAWDRDHVEFDRTDPADNMNCALAAIQMANHFFRGTVTQDRLGYEIRQDRAGNEFLRRLDVFVDKPLRDLNYGEGFFDPEITEMITFAFGGSAPELRTTGATDTSPPTEASMNAFWDDVVREIDAGKPVIVHVPGHAVIVPGYYQFSRTGPRARWVTVNDPWSGRRLQNLTRFHVIAYWLLGSTASPRMGEASIRTDSDGDGIVDFDETERFGTKPDDRDSDKDEVDDKTEVYASVFDPNHRYATGDRTGRDFDGDETAMELDPDSDAGGCKDGKEDVNFNGKRDGGESYNLDKEDDECGVGPLGGRVKMTYTYGFSSGSCQGRVEINARFTLNPDKIPGTPIIPTYHADEMTYDIRTEGCHDVPGDHTVYEFEGLHLSGTLPLTEENLGAVAFWPNWPKFQMHLPYELQSIGEANTLKGTYTTTSGGGPWPAETYVQFDDLDISSNPEYCAEYLSDPGYVRPAHLDFCTEPGPCSQENSSIEAWVECFEEPQRYYVIPFKKSFHWDTPEDEDYKIQDVDVTVEICEGCADEFLD